MDEKLKSSFPSPVFGVAAWKLPGTQIQSIRFASSRRLSALHLDLGKGELSSTELSDEHQNIEQELRGESLAITAITINRLNDIGLICPAESERYKQCQTLIREGVLLSVKLGCSLLCIPSFRKSLMRSESDLRLTARLLSDAADFADQFNITLATENSLSSSGNLKLLDMVERDNFKILMDSYNPFLFGLDPLCLINDLWPFLCDQIHIKNGRDGGMGNQSLDSAESQTGSFLKEIKKRKFSGTLILENNYREGIDFDQDLDFVRSHFKDTAKATTSKAILAP